MEVARNLIFKLAYSQLALPGTITCQLMRYAINSVTNAFNSWSYSAKHSLVYYPLMSFTYYYEPCICGPFVNAKAEKVSGHRYKTEVKTREREERWWAESGNIWCCLSRFKTIPLWPFGLSLSLAVITLSRSLFIARLSFSLSSLPFRPLPLSRRYFRDDELQYAPIVAAGNQRAYPKSSMVSTHPTQPKSNSTWDEWIRIQTRIQTRVHVHTWWTHTPRAGASAQPSAPLK